MPTEISNLAFWESINQTLQDDLQSTLEFLESEPYSEDPASDFQRAQAQVDRINDLVGRFAVLALEQIDDDIAASGIVDEINALAEEAKAEAERLKNAIKTVQGITEAVDFASNVVTQVAGLPFLAR